MRKFRTNIKKETINITLYETVERDSPSLADIELDYTDNKLERMVIFLKVDANPSILLTCKDDFDRLKKIFTEVEECFAVTGYKGFE